MTMKNDTEVLTGEIIPNGMPSSALMQMLSGALQNPGALKDKFNLDDRRAKNVKSLVVGAGAGTGAALSTKYLGDALGEEFAAAIGGFIGGFGSAWLAKKMLG